MEQILTEINNQFSLDDVNPNGYSPLNLAYIGDSIVDVVVKTVIVERGNCPVNKLHKKTSDFVKATSQAKIYDFLKTSKTEDDGNFLTEEEENIMRRGRNAKPYTKAKNASFGEYCKATGFEALIGYLYLQGNTKRLVEIIKLGVDYIEGQ